MTGEHMRQMSCGHEVPIEDVKDHRHDDDNELISDENERHYLKAISVGALSVAGLTAVAFTVARRRLNNKEQE